jgi:protein involved in polysaccharide export with SLBB domain
MRQSLLPLAMTCALGIVALGGCVSTRHWNDGQSLMPESQGASQGRFDGQFDEQQPKRWGFLPRNFLPTALWGRPTDPYAPADDANANFADIGYADWSEQEPAYRFYPGDELEISVPSAPELNRTSVVQPDGRISLNLVAPVMAADRSAPQLQAALTQAYSGVLLRPTVNVAVKSTTPIKVFVGGEVVNPGMFDLIGDGDALRAVIQAGGFKTSAKLGSVVIIRRGPDGRAMMRTVNLSRGIKVANGDIDLVPLRRFDIVYVPRSSVSEASLWVQQYFRDLSPIQFGLNYSLNNPNP